MVTIRSAKAKGANFEYDCQESLQAIYPDIYRTAERGYQREYDLRSDDFKKVFECKRLSGISWNQCVKYLKNLEEAAPDGYDCFLLFKSNRQPCLVMQRESHQPEFFTTSTFEYVFSVYFVKHKSTRRRM